MQVTQESVVLVLSQIVLFLALALVLKRFWFAPVSRVLQERARRSEGALAEARDVQARAEHLRQEHAGALAHARAEAQREVQALLRAAEIEQKKMIDDAKADAERTLAEARDRITQEVAQARRDLEQEVVVLARRAAQTVLGRAVE
jgi:F-type H+-transporting ATPase subunit b